MTCQAWRLPLTCLALAAVLPLTGCPTEKWGDTAQAFVNNNFHDISVQYTAAQLDHDWLSAFFGSAEDMDVRVKQWVLTMPDNPDPMPIDVATATHQQQVQAYTAIDGAIADLDTESATLGELRRGLDLTATVCSDRPFFNARGLEWIGIYGPISVIQPRVKPNADSFEVYFSTSFSINGDDDLNNDPNGQDMKGYLQMFQQIWQGITDHNHVNEQNDKLAEALDDMPNKAVQPDAAFVMSKTSCNRAFTATAKMRQNALSEADDLTQIIASRRALLVVRRDLIGSYLLPEDVRTIADADPGHAILTKTQSTFLRGDLSIEMNNQMQAAKLVGMHAFASSRCSDRLRFFEQYRDMLVELGAQLTVLQQLQGSQGAKDAATFLAAIQQFETDYPAALKRIPSSGCQL
jgi:hypothetical protein